MKKRIAGRKTKPKLAIILIGENKASKIYCELKRKAGKRIGIRVTILKFEASAKEENIIKKIDFLNKDKFIDGIIVQLPLPKSFNTDKIIEAISPEKDVDGFHRINRELLKKGKNPCLFPVLPSAILIALTSANHQLKRKKIISLVNSRVFGENLRNFFKLKGIKIKNILFKRTPLFKLKSELKSADVLITVLGLPKLIKREMIKDKAILIDAGITYLPKRKVVGDVDKQSVEGKAVFLTPIIGGIGPLTVALLLRNTYLAFQKYE